MRKFFGILLIIFAIVQAIAFMDTENGTIWAFILVEFIAIFSAIQLLKKKKVHQKKLYGGDYRSDLGRDHENGDSYSNSSYTEININSDKYDYEDEEKQEEKVEEAPRQVSVTCSGCGAKVKVYRKQFTDCEYCGTTVKAS
ncbi:hypothetical protein Q9R46_12205 [Paenibacillus sp. RRE4]|uniref:hypothetical protein n=1 Tax=Paenibacillus sp. RRE4 TaxID=2962587 RepID=UPI00288173CC|nr:hypothetical protein [Paenibacillus sp. RRE4]MDT0123410.1 hypothetical protein [Paenibacillus sp. RRE4]